MASTLLQQLQLILPALEGQVLDSLQIVPADSIAAQYYPHLDPAQPVLLLGLNDPALAKRVQELLEQVYPPAHPAILIRGGQAQPTIPLTELAQQADFSALTALLLPPLAAPAAYEALQDIVAHLRSPAGCPWDRELTWAKLRGSLLEETHELLAALDAADSLKIQEELGDLLLQVGLQAQIAAEEGKFRFGDVVAGIVAKLIRRHPHVFGAAVVSGTADVLANWEVIKAAERKSNGEKRSPLSGVPKGLPALAQAEAYLDRISRLQTIESPTEPWAALAALPSAATVTADFLGEVLFDLVAWARVRDLDAESALRAANARFAAHIDSAQM